MPQEHRSAGDRRRAGVTAGLDPVRDDRVFRTVQRRHALDHQLVRTDAVNPSPHGDQAGRQIADLRFARGIGQHGASVRQGCRHQQVLGGPHRDERKHDRRSAQPSVHTRLDIAAVQRDPGAHLLQALQVQIDRPHADVAPARQRHTRLAHPSQQRTQHQERSAHLAHDVIRRLGIGDRPADRQTPPVIVQPVHRHAVLRQQLVHGLDVGQARHVRQHQPFVGQHPRGHQRQGGVLGAADGDLARQRPAAANTKTIHIGYILGSETPRWPIYLPALSA